MVAYLSGVHTLCVDTVIILLLVTYITLNIHLKPVSPETQATNRLFKTIKSDPDSIEIAKTKGLL